MMQNKDMKPGLEVMCAVGRFEVMEPVPGHKGWWRCKCLWTYVPPRSSARKVGEIECWHIDNLHLPLDGDVKPEDKVLKYGTI